MINLFIKKTMKMDKINQTIPTGDLEEFSLDELLWFLLHTVVKDNQGNVIEYNKDIYDFIVKTYDTNGSLCNNATCD